MSTGNRIQQGTEAVREFFSVPDQGRANAADREAAAARLARGYADSRITMAEFDQRLAAVWQVGSRTEVAALVADLPAITDSGSDDAAPTGWTPAEKLRAAGIVWVALNLINVMVWALVCVTTLTWDAPWWLWSLVPSGALLLAYRWYLGGGRLIRR